jgi:hypothetical protein
MALNSSNVDHKINICQRSKGKFDYKGLKVSPKSKKCLKNKIYMVSYTAEFTNKMHLYAKEILKTDKFSFQ